MPDLLYRSLLALALILAGWALFRLVSWFSLRRLQTASTPLPQDQKPGTATIVYFTTPDCVACKTTQRPALNRLQEKLGERLKIIEVNAYENPDMAKEWGVLSVPTTFILDPGGAPRQINYGVTPAAKLLQQLQQHNPLLS